MGTYDYVDFDGVCPKCNFKQQFSFQVKVFQNPFMNHYKIGDGVRIAFYGKISKAEIETLGDCVTCKVTEKNRCYSCDHVCEKETPTPLKATFLIENNIIKELIKIEVYD